MPPTQTEINNSIARYYEVYELANKKKPTFTFEYQKGFIIRIEGTTREKWARFKDLIEATKRMEERIKSISKPISWHKEETKKFEITVNKATKEAQKLTEELEFKKLQIATAEANGLTEFDNTTFIKTTTEKTN